MREYKAADKDNMSNTRPDHIYVTDNKNVVTSLDFLSDIGVRSACEYVRVDILTALRAENEALRARADNAYEKAKQACHAPAKPSCACCGYSCDCGNSGDCADAAGDSARIACAAAIEKLKGTP